MPTTGKKGSRASMTKDAKGTKTNRKCRKPGYVFSPQEGICVLAGSDQSS